MAKYIEAVRTYYRRYPEKMDTGYLDGSKLDFKKAINTKSIRTMGTKTQVSPFPENVNLSNRLTHSLSVASIAMDIASGLNQSGFDVDEYACASLGLLHDMGHLIFGHFCEETLAENLGIPIEHGILTCTKVQHVERKGQGLNITHHLKQIPLHSGKTSFSPDYKISPEGLVMKASDKFEYVLKDANDAVRDGFLEAKNLPKNLLNLGGDQREREYSLIRAFVNAAKEIGHVPELKEISGCRSECRQVLENFDSLKAFMYDEIYPKRDNLTNKALIEDLYNLLEKPGCFPDFNPVLIFSIMSDEEARAIRNAFLETGLQDRVKKSDFEKYNFGFIEVLSNLRKYNKPASEVGDERERQEFLRVKKYDPEKCIDYTDRRLLTDPDIGWTNLHQNPETVKYLAPVRD